MSIHLCEHSGTGGLGSPGRAATTTVWLVVLRGTGLELVPCCEILKIVRKKSKEWLHLGDQPCQWAFCANPGRVTYPWEPWSGDCIFVREGAVASSALGAAGTMSWTESDCGTVEEPGVLRQRGEGGTGCGGLPRSGVVGA